MLDLWGPRLMFDAMEQVWSAQLQALRTFTESAGRVTAAITGTRVGDITVYFPFGRGYTQDIEPHTYWGLIRGSKTDRPDIEWEIVRDVASYGKQLGQMMDLLVSLAETTDGVGREELDAVRALKARIDGTKAKLDLKAEPDV